jgi:hypothetical protein
MTILAYSSLATSLHFDENNLWVEFADGRQLAVPLAHLPLLREATPKQRMNYVISGGGTGLHWDELDEDLLVENLLLGITSRKMEFEIQ